MNPVVIAFLRTYAPVILFPVTATFGYVGYKLEWWLKKDIDQAVDREGISELRNQRFIEAFKSDETNNSTVLNAESSKAKRRTIFDKN